MKKARIRVRWSLRRVYCSVMNSRSARNENTPNSSVEPNGPDSHDSQNTTVPTSEQHVFTTVKDNQTSVKILVLQGESEKAAENEMLGEFILTGLRKAQIGLDRKMLAEMAVKDPNGFAALVASVNETNSPRTQ